MTRLALKWHHTPNLGIRTQTEVHTKAIKEIVTDLIGKEESEYLQRRIIVLYCYDKCYSYFNRWIRVDRDQYFNMKYIKIDV